MKTMLMVLALSFGFGALQAQAANLPDKNTSWEALKSDRRVIYRLPQVGLENWFMSLSSICVDEDQLRSKRMVTQCVKWEERGRENERYCTKEIEKYVYTNISGVKTRCAEWGGRDDDRCVRYEDYEYTIKLNRQVPVYKRVRENRNNSEWENSTRNPPIFKKLYSIGECEQ